MQISELIQELLDDALSIYCRHAYERKINLESERIKLGDVKSELMKNCVYGKPLGNKGGWKLMKIIIALNRGDIEFFVDPHHSIYDENLPKELREYNYGLKNIIEREWEKADVPVRGTYFERREEIRKGISK